MNKTFFKTFLLALICAMSISCTFIEETGSVKIKLPVTENTDEGIALLSLNEEKAVYDFNVVLISSDGKEVYNQTHLEGTVIEIENIPIGKYTLIVSSDRNSYILENKKTFYISSGYNPISIELISISKIPEEEPVEYCSISGSIIFENNVIPENMTINLADLKNDNAVVRSETLTNNTFYFEDLTPSVYKVTVFGGGTGAYYGGAISDIILEPGAILKDCIVEVKKDNTKGWLEGTVDFSSIKIADKNTFNLRAVVYTTGKGVQEQIITKVPVDQNGYYKTDSLSISSDYRIVMEGNDSRAVYSGDAPNIYGIKAGKNEVPAVTSLIKKHNIVFMFLNVPKVSETLDIELILDKNHSIKTSIESGNKTCMFQKVLPGTYKLNVDSPNYEVKDFTVVVNDNSISFEVPLNKKQK